MSALHTNHIFFITVTLLLLSVFKKKWQIFKEQFLPMTYQLHTVELLTRKYIVYTCKEMSTLPMKDKILKLSLDATLKAFEQRGIFIVLHMLDTKLYLFGLIRRGIPFICIPFYSTCMTSRVYYDLFLSGSLRQS